MVVEGCGNLNDSLQERFFRFSRSQPDFLPRFVSVEETAGVELLDSPAKALAVLRSAGGCIVLWRVWQLSSCKPSGCLRRNRRGACGCIQPRLWGILAKP
jgi:hypothetical protein